MFSFEIRINSQLIGHISGHNTGYENKGYTKYRYTYYDTEKEKLYKGQVYHLRQDGIRKLINIILEDVDKQDK